MYMEHKVLYTQESVDELKRSLSHYSREGLRNNAFCFCEDIRLQVSKTKYLDYFDTLQLIILFDTLFPKGEYYDAELAFKVEEMFDRTSQMQLSAAIYQYQGDEVQRDAVREGYLFNLSLIAEFLKDVKV